MLDRIMRAIRLDPTLYREVADDESKINEAAIIVIIVSVISALGVLIGSENGLMAFIFQVLNSLLFGWVLWAAVSYFVGANMFQGRSSVNEMLRVLGYANAPRLLGFFSFIPCVGWLIALAGWVLSIAAGVIAIRESMEFDTGKAVITAVIGLLLYLIASVVIGIVWAAVTLPFAAF
jgi:hypothetical protein